MQPPEFILAVVAIVFGSIFGMYLIGKVFSLIKYWLDKKHDNNHSLTSDEGFLNALREFKQKTDRRLSAIETILADDLPENKKVDLNSGSEENTIRVEMNPETNREEEAQKKSAEGKLKNMLNQ